MIFLKVRFILNACSLDLAPCHMCTAPLPLKNEHPMYRTENSVTFFTGISWLIQLLN
jgi:hypothetical protein